MIELKKIMEITNAADYIVKILSGVGDRSVRITPNEADKIVRLAKFVLNLEVDSKCMEYACVVDNLDSKRVELNSRLEVMEDMLEDTIEY